MRRVITVALLAVSVTGCGKGQPTLAGGKPVSYWLHAVHDRDPSRRKAAVFKLGNVGPSEAAALPAVVEALKDPDARVRREAILALLKFGPAAAAAVPGLTEARQKDPDAQVRSYAAQALEKLGRDP